MPPKRKQPTKATLRLSSSESDDTPPARSPRSKKAMPVDDNHNKMHPTTPSSSSTKNKKTKPNTSPPPTDRAHVSLQPTAQQYSKFVADADKSWTRPKQPTWDIEQYFPFPYPQFSLELQDLLDIDHYADFDSCCESWNVAPNEALAPVDEWASLLREYYDELTQIVARHRDSFRTAMTSKDPKITAKGYTWPYKPQTVPKEVLEKHCKEVRELRSREVWEPEYYCSYCDRFIPHSQHHHVTEDHPHHAMCWCKGCTFNYDRMCNALLNLLKDLSRCVVMKDASRCFFAAGLGGSDSDGEDGYDSEDEDDDDDSDYDSDE